MRREKAPAERCNRRFGDTYHNDDDQAKDGVGIKTLLWLMIGIRLQRV
jgi:hypothetical protein